MHVNNDWLLSRSFSDMFWASCCISNRLAVANANFGTPNLLCRLSITDIPLWNWKWSGISVVMGTWLLLASGRTGSLLWATTDVATEVMICKTSQLQLLYFQCINLHKNVTITYRIRSFWCVDCSVIYINNLLMAMHGFFAAQKLNESAEHVKWLVLFHCSPFVYQENNLLVYCEKGNMDLHRLIWQKERMFF